jgi:hypothetical protein
MRYPVCSCRRERTPVSRWGCFVRLFQRPDDSAQASALVIRQWRMSLGLARIVLGRETVSVASGAGKRQRTRKGRR